MTEKEVIDNIVSYLKNKKVDIRFTKINNRYVECEYKKDYSTFKFCFYLDENYYPDKNIKDFTVKYSSSFTLNGTRRRKTKTINNYCPKVYKNILWMIKKFDISASMSKSRIDTKNKYCAELESYYSKIHKSIYVTVSQMTNDIVKIVINGYDLGKTTTYYIVCKNNKYFINSKQIYYENSKFILK